MWSLVTCLDSDETNYQHIVWMCIPEKILYSQHICPLRGQGLTTSDSLMLPQPGCSVLPPSRMPTEEMKHILPCMSCNNSASSSSSSHPSMGCNRLDCNEPALVTWVRATCKVGEVPEWRVLEWAKLPHLPPSTGFYLKGTCHFPGVSPVYMVSVGAAKPLS